MGFLNVLLLGNWMKERENDVLSKRYSVNILFVLLNLIFKVYYEVYYYICFCECGNWGVDILSNVFRDIYLYIWERERDWEWERDIERVR